MAPHPRTIARSWIADLIRAALPGAPVYDSIAVDPSSAPVIVYVHTPVETISKPPGSQSRGGTPLIRSMTVSISILSTYAGDGSDALLQLDDACRQVELKLNAPFDPALVLEAVEVGPSAQSADADQPSYGAELTYRVEIIDTMSEGDI